MEMEKMRISAITGFFAVYSFIFRYQLADWFIWLMITGLVFGFEEAFFWLRKFTTRVRIVRYEYDTKKEKEME